MTQRRIYQSEYPYFVSTVVRDREPAFRDHTLAVHLAETILGACALKSFNVHAWAISPDHMHIALWKSRPFRDVHPLAHFERTCGNHSRAHNGVRCVGESNISPHTHRGKSRTCDNVRSGLGLDPTPLSQRGLSYPRWSTPYGMNPFADISELMKCIKGTFAHDIGDIPFWQPRFYARVIDSERYLHNVMRYIRYHSMKDHLPDRFASWPYVFLRQ